MKKETYELCLIKKQKNKKIIDSVQYGAITRSQIITCLSETCDSKMEIQVCY